MPKFHLVSALLVVAAVVPAPALAAPILYTSQSTFEAQLTGDYTLVNLDAAPLSAFASGYRLDDPAPAAAFLALGIDFIGANAQVLAGQNGQTPTNRDRLIANGVGFGGLIAANFVTPVNGIGAFSNNVDGGRIRAFSEANLGGIFLGEVPFGPGSFGGLTSDVLIRSAQFTCDFNSDLRCGVYDIQFGTFAEPGTAVPEPATLSLFAIGLAGLAARKRRRATAAARRAIR